MGAKLQLTLKPWKEAQQNLQLQNLSVKEDKDLVHVLAIYTLPEVYAQLKLQYTINSKGVVLINQELIADTSKQVPMLPRFGMNWILPEGFDSIRYFGRGPHESYQDRNYSTPVGLYNQSVKERFYPYIRPQENGNKTDIRWFELRNKDGKGIRIESDSLLSMSALHFFDSDLDDGDTKDQRHSGDLHPRRQTQLHIDKVQMGLGGINSWRTWPLEQYRLPYKNYKYQFRITPL
jgi:beta-galactosidase